MLCRCRQTLNQACKCVSELSLHAPKNWWGNTRSFTTESNDVKVKKEREKEKEKKEEEFS